MAANPLVFEDDVTADRSIIRTVKVCKAVVSSQIQSNATTLI